MADIIDYSQALYGQILSSMLDGIPDDLDKREGSIIYNALAPTALMIAQQNYLLGLLFNLLFPDTSEAEWLNRVTEEFGVSRETATFAVRKLKATSRTGESLDLPVGSRFAIEGLTFAVTEKMEEGVCQAVCEQSGTQGNQYSGEILPLDNIDHLGTVTLEGEPLIPARDEETDEELRERFFRTVRRNPYGGNIADYEEKILEIDGVGGVKIFNAAVMGPGQVGIIIGNEQQRPASEELVEQVKELVATDGEGIAPVGHHPVVRSVKSLSVNVSAALRLKTGVSLETVQSSVKQAIEAYIQSIGFEDTILFYARLFADIIDSHTGIVDVESVTINGKAGNIPLDRTFDGFEVPTVGTITLTEVGNGT